MNFETPKFKTPEEEVSYLREQISNIEKKYEKTEQPTNIDSNISNEIEKYKQNKPEEVLEKGHLISEHIRDEIVLELSPEDHDDKMSELISMVYSKGIINTMDIVLKMNDPHITDDFHRFLVQYVKSGYPLNGLKEKTPFSRIIRETLFEVTLSKNSEEDGGLLENIDLMKQFYSGMLSVEGKDLGHMSVEITNAIDSSEFIFYISVSNDKKELLEKQLLAIFPSAFIQEKTNDFNVFNHDGYSAGVYMMQKEVPAKVLKTKDGFSNDPLKPILNVFSKLDAHEEAAAIQLIFKPSGSFYVSKYEKALKKLEKGEKGVNELYAKNTFGSKVGLSISNAINGSGKKAYDDRPAETDSNLIENVTQKISEPIVSTNLRIVVSGRTQERVKSILLDIEAVFNQFENTRGNKFDFKEPSKNGYKNFFKNFSFREFDSSYDCPLNLAEVATVIHFPDHKTMTIPELKTEKMRTSPAPMNVAKEGIHLGTNKNRGVQKEIYFEPNDRLRHFYVIGQTGTGKTNILKNMIVQDIANGEGVCFIDPHGSDVQDILANIPQERLEDVIYFDPGNTAYPMGLNMLEYDVTRPEQKTFVVNELFSIFQKLYGANPESMGPMFEQYFRNATLLAIDNPAETATLLDVSKVLSNKEYRDHKLSMSKNPVVVEFWTNIASKAGGEASLENIVPYITSKFDVFLANDIMRPIISQEKSCFNFRDIMDNRKILLVNLSKGTLGDINSSLIGLILVGKILMASLSRSDSTSRDYPPFYLYIDEFQNVTTDSISTILSEARKYKLSLNIAHQFIAQLDESIKDAVFGNVGSMAIFRVGSDDANYLESQLDPTFNANDIMNIDNYNAYLKMLANGVPVEPFNIAVPKAPDGNLEQVDSLKDLSALKYGKERIEVENEIINRYNKA